MVKRCKLDANRQGFQGEHELYLKMTCKDAQTKFGDVTIGSTVK